LHKFEVEKEDKKSVSWTFSNYFHVLPIQICDVPRL